MTIIIKEANLEKDKDIMISTLNENRKTDTDVKRYEWLYNANPYGKAKAWLAVDDKTGDVAGFTSALPRLMYVFGEEMICWNCCDFSINKKYRTIGVAIKLRRAAKECVDNNIVPFFYAHPNDKMKLIHMKVGHKEIGKMVRFAKVLKVDRKVQKLVKNHIILNCLSSIGNVLLRLTDKKYKHNSHYEFKIYKNSDFRFDDQFDRLFKERADSKSIYGVRSSKYLNWRYIDNPLYSTETAKIKIKDRLAGYVIYLIEDGVAVLKDVFSIENEEVQRNLIGNWIKYLRDREIHSISAIFLNTSKWIKLFENFGFVKRSEETSSVIVYPNSTNKYATQLLNAENWYMTVGDRDV